MHIDLPFQSILEEPPLIILNGGIIEYVNEELSYVESLFKTGFPFKSIRGKIAKKLPSYHPLKHSDSKKEIFNDITSEYILYKHLKHVTTVPKDVWCFFDNYKSDTNDRLNLFLMAVDSLLPPFWDALKLMPSCLLEIS